MKALEGSEWKKEKSEASALCWSHEKKDEKRGLLQALLCVVNVATFHILKTLQERLCD